MSRSPDPFDADDAEIPWSPIAAEPRSTSEVVNRWQILFGRELSDGWEYAQKVIDQADLESPNIDLDREGTWAPIGATNDRNGWQVLFAQYTADGWVFALSEGKDQLPHMDSRGQKHGEDRNQ